MLRFLMAVPAGTGEVVQIKRQLRELFQRLDVVYFRRHACAVLGDSQLTESVIPVQCQLSYLPPCWRVVEALFFQRGFFLSVVHIAPLMMIEKETKPFPRAWSLLFLRWYSGRPNTLGDWWKVLNGISTTQSPPKP